MADPFSVAGSAVGVVALGIKLCEDFVAFTGHVKDGKGEVLKMTARLDMLEDHLEKVQTIVTQVGNSGGGVYNNSDLGISALATALDELRRKLPKSSQKNGDNDLLRRFRQCRQRLAYPFKREELLFLKDLVQDLQQNLTLALQALQLAQQQHNHLDTRNHLISLSQQTNANMLSIREGVLDVQSAVADTVKSALVPVSAEQEMMMRYLTTIAASVTKLETRLTDTTPTAYLPTSLNGNALQLDRLHQKVSGNLSTTSRVRPFTDSLRPYCLACGSTTVTTKKLWKWRFISVTHESHQQHSEECCHASYSKAHTSLELRLQLCFYLLKRKTEVAFRTWSQNGISNFTPTFRVWRVVPNDAPAFRLIREFNDLKRTVNIQVCIQELTKLFSMHQAFPNDRLLNGQNLLHQLGISMFKSRPFFREISPDHIYTTLTNLLPFLLGAMGQEMFTEVDCKGRSALELCTQLKTNEIYFWYRHFGDGFSNVKNFEAYYTGLNSLVQRKVLDTTETETGLLNAVLNKSSSRLRSLITCLGVNDCDVYWKRHRALTHIASGLGWHEGCKILLRNCPSPSIMGLNLLYSAARSRDPDTVRLFLRQRRKSGKQSSLGFHDLERVVYQAHYYDGAARLCEIELIKQRQKISQLVRKHLGSHNCLGRDDRILDAGAHNAVRALSRKGIHLKLYLHPIQASVYHNVTYVSAASLERLYVAGFHDIKATNFRRYSSVVPPLVWHSLQFHYQYTVREIEICKWLISKGAKLKETWGMLPSIPAWKILAYSFCKDVIGDVLFRWHNRETTNFTLSLLALEEKDSCSCLCSIDGCSTISIYLQGALRYMSPTSPLNRQQLFITISWLAPVVRQDHQHIVSVLRVLTFWQLGLNHTCCNIGLLLSKRRSWIPPYGWYLDFESQAQLDLYHRCIENQQGEVGAEEEFLRDYFQDLIQVMENEFNASGQDIVEFVMGSWSTEMLQALQDLGCSDHKAYRMGREELGVKLLPPDFSKSALIGKVNPHEYAGNHGYQSPHRVYDFIPNIRTLDERTWVIPLQESDEDESASDDDNSEGSVYPDDNVDPEESFWKGFDDEGSSYGLSSDDYSEDSDSNDNDNNDSDDDSDIFVDIET